jgi:hypothetical protein
MQGGRGPQVIDYLIPLDRPRMYRWSDVSDDVDNAITAIRPQGGAAGAWLDVPEYDRGTDLTDASVTIRPSGNRWRVLPAATLTTDRVLTLGAPTATETFRAGHCILITNQGQARVLTIVNGGPAAGNVAVMPVTSRSWCLAMWDGTDWIHRASGLALAAT